MLISLFCHPSYMTQRTVFPVSSWSRARLKFSCNCNWAMVYSDWGSRGSTNFWMWSCIAIENRKEVQLNKVTTYIEAVKDISFHARMPSLKIITSGFVDFRLSQSKQLLYLEQMLCLTVCLHIERLQTEKWRHLFTGHPHSVKLSWTEC